MSFPRLMIRTGVWFWVLLSLSLSACSRMPNTKAIEVSIQTRVNQAIKQTEAASTVLAIQKTADHETIEASKPTSTHTSTATEVSTPTQTPSPSLTPSSTPTLTPTETLPASRVGIIPENVIFFYLTLVGTGGSVGCGDSLVKISTSQYRSGDVSKDLKIALDAIFMSGQYFGGAYNATYPSRRNQPSPSVGLVPPRLFRKLSIYSWE